MVAFRRGPGWGSELVLAAPRDPACAPVRHVEIVADPVARLLGPVGNEDLVGQVEHQIRLFGRGMPASDRLKLEDKIISERAIQAEVWFVRASEEIAKGAQHRENGWLPAPFFLREHPFAFPDVAGKTRPVSTDRCHVGMTGKRLVDRIQQYCAPAVERRDLEAPSPAFE